MSITFDLTVQTDHPTASPPVAAVLFGYEPVGNMANHKMDGVYDGDGVRVQEVQPSLTRTYVGDHYELAGTSVRKYYSMGGARVAESVDGTLYFLLSDHLGSTALTTDREGGRTAELRYYPYGSYRYNTGG